jgi:mono/diheme cytochrome c family protein
MKKFWIIAGCLMAGAGLVSCGKVRRSPGRAYMPDMTYSRAYETYSSTAALEQKGIHYNAMPVEGTIARGDTLSAYPYKNDSAGYANSKNVANPLPALTAVQFKEATRLYLIYCGICHGDKLDGNGPLWKGGEGPFPAAPRNFMTDPVVTNMPEGTMFHSITYGKNLMGSYASQLSPEQRWMIIHYIKEKQAASAAVPAAAPDSMAVKGN